MKSPTAYETHLQFAQLPQEIQHRLRVSCGERRRSHVLSKEAPYRLSRSKCQATIVKGALRTNPGSNINSTHIYSIFHNGIDELAGKNTGAHCTKNRGFCSSQIEWQNTRINKR
jgi:hypothetical protein